MSAAAVRRRDTAAAIRVGLGLCFYENAKLTLALRAMDRALQLSPNNVEALIGQAVLKLAMAENSHNRALVESTTRQISRAYEMSDSNAMALNKLADHFFLKWSTFPQGVATVRHIDNCDLSFSQ